MKLLCILIILLLVYLSKKKENFQESLVNFPLYWINLERSNRRVDRKKFLRLGIHNHTRVSAVDAKKLGTYNFTIPRDYFSTHSTNEIACTLSHLKCMKSLS